MSTQSTPRSALSPERPVQARRDVCARAECQRDVLLGVDGLARVCRDLRPLRGGWAGGGAAGPWLERLPECYRRSGQRPDQLDPIRLGRPAVGAQRAVPGAHTARLRRPAPLHDSTRRPSPEGASAPHAAATGRGGVRRPFCPELRRAAPCERARAIPLTLPTRALSAGWSALKARETHSRTHAPRPHRRQRVGTVRFGVRRSGADCARAGD